MKQKKKLRKMLCLVLAAGMLLSNVCGFSMNVYAAEDNSATRAPDVIEATLLEMPQDVYQNPNLRTVLASCTITYRMSSAGIHVEINTGCAQGTASLLGVKDIKIQKKVWWGWDTIATSSGGQDTNCGMMGIEFNYANMTVGETYRISCVHYGNYDGYTELPNETSAFIFRY